MRILYLTDTRMIGGAERSLADLADGAAQRGHEVLLLAPQPELVAWLGREAPHARAGRAFSDAYHDAPSSGRRAGALLGALARLTRSIKRLGPDVVHINNGGFPGSDLCRVAAPAARAAGVECRVMTVHSNPWARAREADARVQLLADRLVWASLHVVVSPSSAVADGLCTHRGMPSELGRTIYYGVPRASVDPSNVQRVREQLAPNGELLVGMVSARPVPEKGYDVFVQALAGAKERVRGVLVGPAPEELLALMRAAGVEDRLTIAGVRRNVGDYYCAFDLLVMPSTAEECMPLVILEAASVGTPALASRLAGVPEAITNGVGGRLFRPGAAGELSALIDQAARTREQTAAMGAAAQLRWGEQFQLETMVARTLEVYESQLYAGRAAQQT